MLLKQAESLLPLEWFYNNRCRILRDVFADCLKVIKRQHRKSSRDRFKTLLHSSFTHGEGGHSAAMKQPLRR